MQDGDDGGGTVKMSGEVLRFERDGESYQCINKAVGYSVGDIVYYPPWQAWVFKPVTGNLFAADMLGDIKRFMEQLT